MRLSDRMASKGKDSGLSLMEVLVAMALSSIVLATCATLFLGSLKTTTGTQGRLEEINDGRVAISAMGKAMRTAILPSQLFDTSSTVEAAFIEATPTSIRFYGNLNNADNLVGPSKITFEVVGGQLRQTVQKPAPFDPANPKFIYCVPGTAGCMLSYTVLARGVLLTNPIFNYYDSLGNSLAGATLTEPQLEIVDSVDISVTVAKNGVGGNGSTFVLRVALPNHDAVMRESES
jgi:prepilin-type N-terminal cleavage/methylation domain-containing protein